MEHPKFIIQDGELRMGRVEIHFELAKGGDSAVVGGGYCYYDIDNDILYLYGTSIEFGQVNIDQIKESWKRPLIENSTIIFSESDSLDIAMELGTKI